MGPDMVTNACRFIAQMRGVKDEQEASFAQCGCGLEHPEKALVYKDDKLVIVIEEDSLAVVAILKENGNPFVLCKGDGNRYRWHGEGYHLLGHIGKILQQIMEDFNESARIFSDRVRGATNGAK